MFRNRRSFICVEAGNHIRRRFLDLHGALLGLAAILTLFPGDASAQAKHYPLESTTGLRLVNATAEPATLDGKKGLRVTLSKEAQAGTSQLPQAQRATGEALVVIEGLEFVNGVIEAEIAGAPAPGAPESSRGFVGIAFRVQNDMRTFEQFYLRPTNGRADDQERRNHTVQYSSHPDWPFFRTRKETPSKYEAYVDALQGVWTKVRIEVHESRARLYVHGQEQPTLIVNDLKMGSHAKGAVALTPGPNSIVYFRNVTVTPASAQPSDLWQWLAAQAAGFSGVALVGRGDVVEIESAHGFADPAGNRRNAVDTRFNLGSINKTFTAVAIAQLIQQGRLSLDDTVARRLPEYPNPAAAARITIRDLLAHRSGVAQFRRADFGDVSVAAMVKTVGAEPQAFEPGSRQEYSNGGYVVLGRIIEVASGKTYGAYVSDHIYGPAGMTATGFFRQGDRNESVALPVASATGGRSMGPGPGMAPAGPSTGNPAGGGYSTAADLFRFARALRSGRLLDQRMTQDVLNGTFAEQPRWGFALREQTIGSHRFIGNGGGAPGVNAEFRFEPSGDRTVVVLANSSPPAATDLLTVILNRVAGVFTQK